MPETALAAIAGIAVVAAVGYPLFWYLECKHLEKPAYRVLRKLGENSEVRHYAKYIVAESEISGSNMGNAMNQGFRNVAGFIFGSNTRKEKIAMTAPVRAEPSSEKIAMTAPVRAEPTGSSYKVSFFMPSKYTLETLPVPKDARVTLKEVPEHVCAAITFSGGSPSEQKWANYQEQLQAEMAAAGLAPEGNPSLLQYHPPFCPGFIRQNEVLLKVKGGEAAVLATMPEEEAAAAGSSSAAGGGKKE